MHYGLPDGGSLLLFSRKMLLKRRSWTVHAVNISTPRYPSYKQHALT